MFILPEFAAAGRGLQCERVSGWKMHIHVKRRTNVSSLLHTTICGRGERDRLLCDAVLSSWPIACKFDPGSRQLLGERDSTLSLTLRELYGVQLLSLEII